jgi:hypothetical protein
MKEKRFGKAFLEKPQSGKDAGPSPALVGDVKDFDFERIPWRGVSYGDRSRQCVDLSAVDSEKLID